MNEGHLINSSGFYCACFSLEISTLTVNKAVKNNIKCIESITKNHFLFLQKRRNGKLIGYSLI